MIRRGAIDDTPTNARQRARYRPSAGLHASADSASLDFFADGKLLAVAGFHEVLLIDAASQSARGPVDRHGERIQSVRFSPDGGRLAVAGGLPGRMGESRFGMSPRRSSNCPRRSRSILCSALSWSATANGSPLLTDNSVRPSDADSGEQVMFQGGHPIGFSIRFSSPTNSHVVSAAAT